MNLPVSHPPFLLRLSWAVSNGDACYGCRVPGGTGSFSFPGGAQSPFRRLARAIAAARQGNLCQIG
jgi:hypothetical protein